MKWGADMSYSSYSRSESSEPGSDVLKIAIMGDVENSKAALLTRLAHAPSGTGTFSTNYVTRFGKDYRIRNLLLDGMRIRVELWQDGPLDACGRSLVFPPSWLDAHGVIYLCSDTHSLEAVSLARHALSLVRVECPHLPKILVEDARNTSQVQVRLDDPRINEELTSMTHKLGVETFQVSILNGSGVEQMLMATVKSGMLYKWQHGDEIERGRLQLAAVNEAVNPKKGAKHCIIQ